MLGNSVGSRALLLVFVFFLAGASIIVDGRLASAQQSPQPVGPGVIETDADEYGPTLSADEHDLYFVRRQNRNGNETIFHSHLTGDTWSEPQVVSFSGEYFDKEPFLSPDGQQIFFASTRPAPSGANDMAFDLWVVARDGDDWGEPTRLPDTVNSDGYDNYPSVAANGNLYFGSRPGASGTNMDLYVARWVDGAYQQAEKLGDTINSPSTEADPFIAPDESYLIFISTRDGGHGSGDLYISRRDGDGWSAAENMGPSVNGDDFDYTPFVSGNGEKLYFARGWGEMLMTSFVPWQQ